MADYLTALEREAGVYEGETFSTIYIGGGTPTFLAEPELDALFSLIHRNFRFSDQAEVTIEGNPEGLTKSKLNLLKSLGVNRFSLGIQTLNDRYLRFLGRVHDRVTALEAFEQLRAVGFSNISVDIMYSFPGQTEEEIECDVREIAALNSEHLSCYALTIEENSRFSAQKVSLAEGELRARQFECLVQSVEETPLKQYEISNFSRPGFESRHNTNYWRGGEYLGLGVGAHSLWKGERRWNVDKLAEYLTMPSAAGLIAGRERLSNEQRLVEMLLIGLRMNGGVDLVELESRFACRLPLAKVSLLENFESQGWLNRDANRIWATPSGRLILDELSVKLI